MVRISRRALGVHGLAGAMAFATTGSLAQGAWPTRPITLVVGFAAGSSTDIAARILAERLSETLGQRVVVENKPGAASRIATDAVARAPKDGYTLMVGTIANVIGELLAPGAKTFSRELMPVALFAGVPNILTVPSASGITTVPALLKAARGAPEPLTYGSPGIGTAPHMSGELLAQLAGVKLTHVPYNGSAQAVTDLLAGRISMMFTPAATALQHVQSGALKALATTARDRSPIAPELPTVAEAGLAGFDTSLWFGVVAPAGTPADIVARLAAAVDEAGRSEALRTQFLAQGIEVLSGGPDAFRDFIAAENRRWEVVIDKAGLAKR